MTTASTTIATDADIDAICTLLSDLFSQEAEFFPDPVKQTRAVGQIIAQPELGHILLLRLDEQVAGMVSLLYLPSTALGGKVAMLEDMIIAHEYRSQGYGRQLLNAAINFARQQGCLRLTLLTDSDNLPAQQFYQQHGFSLSAMLPMRMLLED